MQLPLAYAAIAAGAFAAGAGGAVAAAPPGCVRAPDDPPWTQQIRPQQNADCAYDAAELHRRILSLFGRRGALTIAEVEQTFGLPPLGTGFDDPHAAHYGVVMRATPERGGWQLMLNFSETFPSGSRQPPRFRGSLRPVPVDSRRRGDLRLHLIWLRPALMQFGSPHCLSVERLSDEAQRSGWRGDFNSHFVFDAPPRWALDLERGRERATTDVTGETGCVNDLEFTRDRDGG